jgi:hypothetical protein
MGGPGSGAHYQWWRGSKKDVVEDCLVLDVNRLMREGILKEHVYAMGTWRWTYPGGGSFAVCYDVDTVDTESPSVRLSYSWVWTSTREQESAAYTVLLTTTRPRFGGLRWWFVCPLRVNGRECGRRVGKLYLPPRGRYFGCRHCYELTYTSCQESRKYDGLARLLALDMGSDLATAKRALNRIGKGP